MNSKIAVAVVLAAVLAAMLIPISTPTPAFAAEVTAEIPLGASSKTTDAYTPYPININVGDTVTWINKDTISSPHTVTSGSAESGSDGKFDSGLGADDLMYAEDTFSHTFTEAGTYPYYCVLHANTMKGTVIVAAGNGGPQEFSVTATDAGKNYEITGKSATSKATEATIQSGQSVTIKFDKPGEVELTFPKTVIEGINDVNAGGQKINVTPTTSGDSSTIKFTIPEGATTVVIKGAKVVPEFPVIAAILAATIAGIIGYTRFARSGTGFFGRA